MLSFVITTPGSLEAGRALLSALLVCAPEVCKLTLSCTVAHIAVAKRIAD
jgi:hypothetical protein